MPVMNGIDAALHIKNLLPDTKIIMLTSFSEKHLVLSSFKSGANAYCLKNIPPNEPLTQADVAKMHFDRVWIDYGLDDEGEQCGEEGVVLYGKLYSIDTLEGAGFEDMLLDICDGETLDRPSGNYTVYRRPPEGEDKL